MKVELTERKKAEKLLEESEIRFQDLYESSRDAYSMVDIHGKIIEYNSTYREMLGYDDGELKQMTYKDITPQKWHQMEEQIMKDQVFIRGYSEIYEKEYIRKDGTVFPIEIRSYLLKNKEDKPKYMWAFIRDVTERKKEEEERKKLQDQLHQVQKLEAIGTMAGGVINVYSEISVGSVFHIYLPAEDEDIQEQRDTDEPLIKGNEYILLVDDEEKVLNVARRMLTKLGYQTQIADSGKAAIEIFRKKNKNIDLIILDMVMPDKSGGETYDQLKEIDSNVKVLLSSGYSLKSQATKILAKGCNGFIQKPFDLHRLSKKCREILDIDLSLVKPGS